VRHTPAEELRAFLTGRSFHRRAVQASTGFFKLAQRIAALRNKFRFAASAICLAIICSNRRCPNAGPVFQEPVLACLSVLPKTFRRCAAQIASSDSANPFLQSAFPTQFCLLNS